MATRGYKGHSGDSVLSLGDASRDKNVVRDPDKSPDEPLALSSPTSPRDHDSGVYTAEDLFRDMLAKRGKGLSFVPRVYRHYWLSHSSAF